MDEGDTGGFLFQVFENCCLACFHGMLIHFVGEDSDLCRFGQEVEVDGGDDIGLNKRALNMAKVDSLALLSQ